MLEILSIAIIEPVAALQQVGLNLDIARSIENHHKSASNTWIEAIAESIEQINSGACPVHLVNAIGALVKFDMAMSVVYSRRAKPFYVCDTFQTEKAKRGLSNYINSTYVLSPPTPLTAMVYSRASTGFVSNPLETGSTATTIRHSKLSGYSVRNWNR